MNTLVFLGATFMLLYALWLFYLAVMALKSAKDGGRLTTTGKVFGYPILLIGYGLDIVVNLTIMTIVMLELPHEFVVSDRVSRHFHNSTGFRHSIAKWFCDNLLDPFDPSGCHCK